jgi:hypothetical protein
LTTAWVGRSIPMPLGFRFFETGEIFNHPF